MIRIIQRLEDAGESFGPCALTIGNFDGAHVGHQHIFRRVVELAAANGISPSVLTFDPHPARVLAPGRALRLLTTTEQRCALMESAGIRQALILPFTREFSQLSAEDFVRMILVERLRAQVILIGENFRFGNRQAGDVHLLAALGTRYGFTTEVIPGVRLRGRLISSSEVRRLIETGAAGAAARLLGRSYAIEGQIVSGHGVGAKQTVPTLNLATKAEVLPAVGVYVTRTIDMDSKRAYVSVTNIGHRPTFGGTELSIETFLLDPLEGESPRQIRVAFLWRLRDERKFANPVELKAQILRDVTRARAYFRRVARWTRLLY